MERGAQCWGGGRDADVGLGRWASLPGRPPATSVCVFGIACLGPGPSPSLRAGVMSGELYTAHCPHVYRHLKETTD